MWLKLWEFILFLIGRKRLRIASPLPGSRIAEILVSSSDSLNRSSLIPNFSEANYVYSGKIEPQKFQLKRYHRINAIVYGDSWARDKTAVEVDGTVREVLNMSLIEIDIDMSWNSFWCYTGLLLMSFFPLFPFFTLKYNNILVAISKGGWFFLFFSILFLLGAGAVFSQFILDCRDIEYRLKKLLNAQGA